MMTAAWMRLELRRRWRSLLVLALLVALAAATVMTALAGARRGASAMDRLQDATLPATVLVAPTTPGFDWTPVRELAGVEALGLLVNTGYEIDGRPGAGSFMLPPADAETMRTLERPVVLDGRLADPGRPDEVVVTPAFTRTSGKSVGDTVELGLYTPGQVDTGQVPGGARTNLTDELWILTYQQQAAAVAAGLEPNPPGVPAEGPVVEATIVGVIRSPLLGDQLDTPGFVVPSAGLFASYQTHLLGAEGLASVSAVVRLTGGAVAIPAFRADLAEVTGRPDITVHDLTEPAAAIGDTLRFEAAALYVLAVAAAAAAVFLIGGSVSRQVTSALAGLRVLSAVGMTPGQVAWAAAAGPAGAAAAGTVLGAAVAVASSRWFPVGSASFYEPAPGLDVDMTVLLPGLLLPSVLVTAAAAALALLHRPAPRPARSSVLTGAVARSRLPVPVALGARFALERGAGRATAPVRPALVGAVIGVAGVLAALVFSAAAREAAENPARFGVVHQIEAWTGFDHGALAVAEDVFPALVEVPGVRGLNAVRGQSGDAGGVQVTVLAFTPAGEPPEYPVPEGRLPAGDDEALVSLAAADTLGVGTGDVLSLAGTEGETEVSVVGVGVLGPGIGLAAVVSPALYDELFAGSFYFEYAEIGVEPGVDPATLFPALAAAVPDQTYGILPVEFQSPAELRLMQSVPLVLGGCVALLAVGAVGHGLVTAVRQRRREIAVLRALGLTPRQSRVAVTVQSLVLAGVGLAFGVPLGLAAGRTVWRSVAGAMQAHYVSPAGWPAAAFVVLLALLAAVLLATWPAWRAASMRIGAVLRAE